MNHDHDGKELLVRQVISEILLFGFEIIEGPLSYQVALGLPEWKKCSHVAKLCRVS